LKQRSDQAARLLDCGHSSSLLYATLIKEDEQFKLSSNIWLPTDLMNNLYKFLDFIEDIEYNPEEVLNTRYQNNFLDAVKNLKPENLSLVQLNENSSLFKKDYIFSSFSLKTGDSLYLISISDKKEVECKEISLNGVKTEILINLFENGILDYDAEKVEAVKRDTRLKYIESGLNQDILSRYGQFRSNTKSVDSILAINLNDFSTSIEKLDEMNVLSNSDIFKLNKGYEYLKPTIDEIVSKQ